MSFNNGRPTINCTDFSFEVAGTNSIGADNEYRTLSIWYSQAYQSVYSVFGLKYAVLGLIGLKVDSNVFLFSYIVSWNFSSTSLGTRISLTHIPFPSHKQTSIDSLKFDGSGFIHLSTPFQYHYCWLGGSLYGEISSIIYLFLSSKCLNLISCQPIIWNLQRLLYECIYYMLSTLVCWNTPQF